MPAALCVTVRVCVVCVFVLVFVCCCVNQLRTSCPFGTGLMCFVVCGCFVWLVRVCVVVFWLPCVLLCLCVRCWVRVCVWLCSGCRLCVCKSVMACCVFCSAGFWFDS